MCAEDARRFVPGMSNNASMSIPSDLDSLAFTDPSRRGHFHGSVSYANIPAGAGTGSSRNPRSPYSPSNQASSTQLPCTNVHSPRHEVLWPCSLGVGSAVCPRFSAKLPIRHAFAVHAPRLAQVWELHSQWCPHFTGASRPGACVANIGEHNP